MKRALTGIAAAGLGLGMMAPAVLAGSGPTWHKSNIHIGSYVANGVFDYNAAQFGTDTTFMPVYYVLQTLKSLGYSYTYDGKVLKITTPGDVTPDTSNLALGTGNLTIEINGKPVKMVYTQVYRDPVGGAKAQLTTYIPIFYIQQILDAVQVLNSWDGTNWTGQQVAVFITGNHTIPIGGRENLALSLKGASGNAITPKNVQWSMTSTGAVIDPVTGTFVANQAGTYTVTVTADSLTASTQVVVYGAAASFRVGNPTRTVSADTAYTDQAGGGTPITTVTVTIVDQNGNPVPYTGALNVTNQLGGDLSLGSANAQTTVLSFSNSAAAKFNVYGNTVRTSNTVGTTTFDITDPNNVFPLMTTSLAVTAGSYVSANLVGGNPSLNFYTTSKPSTLVSYQLYDAEGNKVTLAGVPITFTATAGGSNGASDSATIGGRTATAAAAATVTASTDTNGVATVAFSATANLGDTWTVAVSNINNATTPVAGTGIETIVQPKPKMATTVPTTMTLGAVTPSSYGSPVNTDFNTVATIKDQNCNTMASSSLTGSSFTVKFNTASFTYTGAVPTTRTASNLFTYDSATGKITLYLGTGTTLSGSNTISVTYGAASANVNYAT